MTREQDLRHVDTTRWRLAISLTATMIVLYAAFIVLIAYGKAVLTRTIVPGLSIGILLGALLIVAAWVLIWGYIRWANRVYDPLIAALRARR